MWVHLTFASHNVGSNFAQGISNIDKLPALINRVVFAVSVHKKQNNFSVKLDISSTRHQHFPRQKGNLFDVCVSLKHVLLSMFSADLTATWNTMNCFQARRLIALYLLIFNGKCY